MNYVCAAYTSFCILTTVVIGRVINTENLQKSSELVRIRRSSYIQNCEDFRLNKWTTWGPCTPLLGYQIQIRWRARQEPLSYQGPKCPKEWNQKECNPLDSENSKNHNNFGISSKCDVTEWTNWSGCYKYMTMYERERHRAPYYSKTGSYDCSDFSTANLVQYEECSNRKPKEVECSWTPWTQCFNYGSTESPLWERYRENKPRRQKTSASCPGKWVQFQECEYCEWSMWRTWSTCYEYSSNFERKRERGRKQSNSLLGQLCHEMEDSSAEQYGDCTLQQLYDKAMEKKRTSTSTTTVSKGNGEMYAPDAQYSFEESSNTHGR